MTVWHVVLYAMATLVALRSFIQLAERRASNPPKRTPSVGSMRKAV